MSITSYNGDVKEKSELLLRANGEYISIDKDGIVRIDDMYLDIRYCEEEEFIHRSNNTTNNKRCLLLKLREVLR